MRKYNTIFMDLDGTLTESEPGILNSIRYALNKIGHPIPPEEVLIKFIGPPLMAAFAEHCNLTGAAAENAQTAYREYFSVRGMFENSVYEGIPEALEMLRDAGLKLIIATSKPEEYSLKIAGHFGLEKYFDFIAGAAMDTSRNSKAKVIAYALKKLNVSNAGEVLMVGDRSHDVLGAAENGMDCLGVTYGYGSVSELTEAGAIALAASPLDMAGKILGLC